MPISADDFKWWHWLIGAGIAAVGAIWGGGMASQRFIDGVQQRLNELERKMNSFYRDGDLKFMQRDEFGHAQNICQSHMVTLIDDVKESNKALKKSVDELIRLLISRKN